jgi:Protein of unknown function (DUF4236)
LNFSKTGVGASIGGGGARYSAHSSGRRTVSAQTGISGLTYQKSVRAGTKSSRSREAAAQYSNPSSPSKPSLFAPKGEKQLYQALKSQNPQAVFEVGDERAEYRLASYSLAGLMMLASDEPTATRLLENAFALNRDPAADRFVAKYVYGRVELSIAPGITAELPIA